jgi:uncharacterized protein YecT (DUF1311 family)
MKNILFLFILIISTSSFSQTQSEINEEAYNNYKKADKELNVVYQKILNDYKSDTAFLKNLKAAQKIWINFRDAEMLAKFPDREPGYYGSIQPTCWSNYLQELTEERTKRLKVWLTGIEEGNMCSGSVNIK